MRRTWALLVACAALAAAVIPPARAAAPSPPWKANRGQLDRTIDYMRAAQNPDGGFGGAKGMASDPLFTAWVIVGLAAAGINPKDQHVLGGTDAYTYVTEHAGALSDTTDYERALLVAVAAGTSPRDFGGRDLVADLLARGGPTGRSRTPRTTAAAGSTTPRSRCWGSAPPRASPTGPRSPRGAPPGSSAPRAPTAVGPTRPARASPPT